MDFITDSNLESYECHEIDWGSRIIKTFGKNLSISSINMRSLSNKFAELNSYLTLAKHHFSFIVLVETWLNANNDIGLEIEGYKSTSLYRDAGAGGVVKIYYRDHISVSDVPIYTGCFLSCESLFVKAHVPNVGTIHIGGLYRPPQKPISLFSEFVENLMTQFTRSRVILTGDFNVDISKPELPGVRDFMDTMISEGYSNEITLPTYVSPINNEESSILDHCWHNLDLSRRNYVIKPNISDHNSICVVFNSSASNDTQHVKFRDFSDRNKNSFLRNLDNEFSLFPQIHDETPENYSKILNDFLHKLLNKYFPFKTKTFTEKRLKSPWLTPDIISCIDKKHDWFKLLKRKLITYECYKTYCKALRHLLNLAEFVYIRSQFNRFGKNSTKNWRLLNKLLNRKGKAIADNFDVDGIAITDARIIANKFNQHFVEHPQYINESIGSPLNDYSDLLPTNMNSMRLFYSSAEEVSQIISSMKKNGGLNDIPVKFFKLCNCYVSLLLSHLFNLCITHKAFPNDLKVARVIPVHKKGPRDKIPNHRPISILPNICKIYENLIYKRTKYFFHNNNLLSDNQFGFREGRNTEVAILNLVNRLLPALKEKKFAISIFLDFSACFDTVNRTKLLAKLEKMGVRGYTGQFFESFLSNRKQYVSYKNVDSTIRDQKLGVIQGSKMGPMFYDIYSTDLSSLCAHDEFLLYADDTCLTYQHENIDILINHVNERLKIINDWCMYNELSINPAKSEFMIITNKSLDATIPTISINNAPIQQKTCVKYLGVNIDCTLKFYNHAELLKTKLAMYTGVARRLSKYLNLHAAKNYYYSCIYSSLVYCISVYGGVIHLSYKGKLLVEAHEKIVKILFGKFFPFGSNIFKELGILKLHDIHRLYASLHIYKILALETNDDVGSLMTFERINHQYPTSSVGQLRIPFPRVESVKFNFEFQLKTIWNSIPILIKKSNSVNIFKKSLAKFYLDQY